MRPVVDGERNKRVDQRRCDGSRPAAARGQVQNDWSSNTVAMNKKQKKQIDVARKKIQQLQQLMAGIKTQLDDPEELRSLQAEIDKHEAAIEKIKAEG